MTIGEKKQGRYFLPAYPWLNLMAAAGLVGIWDLGFGILRRRSARVLDFYITRNSQLTTRITPHILLLPLLLIILLVNGFLVAKHFPYDFT